ncbi:unnamed protein product [Brassica napus]|uniref:(rape) hypothetical protein n=1 Tax=Brassica napus TaxID=3708 RepID=A0A816LI03_BRANA|nr:unnamed protein product [Brassica napus]
MMLSSSLCWVIWKFLHLLIPGENRAMSPAPLVIILSRFLIRLSELSFIVFGVLIFPSIRCESLVCDSRFSTDVCLSDSGFGGVSQVRDPKHPWPPPGFFLFDEQSGRGWCIVIVRLSLVVIICGWFRFIIVQMLEQKEIMMMRNGWDWVLLDPKYKGRIQGSGDSKERRWKMMLFLQHNNLELKLYGFQSKRMSMPWITTMEHVISCSGSVWDGLRCNRWIASNDLFQDKRRLLTKVESHMKDLTRPRKMWRKASKSAYPTNALGNIVLSLLKVFLNNVFVVIYVPCDLLH